MTEWLIQLKPDSLTETNEEKPCTVVIICFFVVAVFRHQYVNEPKYLTCQVRAKERGLCLDHIVVSYEECFQQDIVFRMPACTHDLSSDSHYSLAEYLSMPLWKKRVRFEKFLD